MANESTYYKRYSRSQRVQNSEETFDKGMSFTKAPLAQGFHRLLVNYNFIDDGASLIPRSGLRVNSMMLPLQVHAKIGMTRSPIAVACRDVVEEDDKHNRLVVCGELDEPLNKVTDTGLYTGSARMYVMDSNGGVIDTFKEYGINARDTYFIDLNKPVGASEGIRTYFNVPQNRKVHDMIVEDSDYVATHVGCFAYGNTYYCFNTNKQLMRSVYKPAGDLEAHYESEVLPARNVTPKEAVLWGYNMLHETPYNFTDSYFAGTIQLLGLLPYDKATNQIKLSPMVNETFKLRCFYQGAQGTKYKIVWEWKETSGTTWNNIATQEIEITASTIPQLSQDFSSPAEAIMVRVQAYKWKDTAYETLVEKVMTVGFSFSKTGYGTSANLDLKTYDLTKAAGMVYWQNRLFLYGLAQDPTILFASEINDPSYFPYPNNTDIFDEPIVHAMPFLDNLLVFTRSKLIQLTVSEDGATWTRKTIQGNLDFTDWDVHLIQIVKNMVFFKSGNYYYMVVPKTVSLRNELAIAPVSKSIEYLLDDFSVVTKDLIELIYGYKGTLELVHYFNYLDYEDVNNVYVFRTSDGLLINVALLYNTLSRTWRIHIYESQSIYKPFKQDATKQGILMARVVLTYENVGFDPMDVLGIQFLEYDKSTVSDFYVPQGTRYQVNGGVYAPDAGAMQAAYALLHKYKNYQLLDTGYRDHTLDYNKRYREIQFKFNNISKETLHFGTDFILDGETRVPMMEYNVEHITDVEDPNVGLIYISATPIDAISVPGNTILGSGEEDMNAWQLDVSRFPEVMLWKARMEVSGKGFAPRFRLLSKNESRYEFLGYTWVFRSMNSR